MSEAPQAAIRFSGFIVKESHIVLHEQSDREFGIKVNFTPRGYVLKSLNQFHLEFGVDVTDDGNTFTIQIKSIATFEYEPGADIEDYKNSLFILNAPAIAFPYIRAYIANLTAQSGLYTITLPTFNLSSLGETLRNSIHEVE